MSQYLTKSAFSLGATCPTKLYYFLSGYPSNTVENQFLELLAEGGFIVGALAQLLYPDGIMPQRKGSPEEDFEETKNLLANDGTLFEATVIGGSSLAVTDILQRQGNTIRLIEVKSKSIDDSEEGGFRSKKGAIRSGWKPYLADVAFQYRALVKAFPSFRIEPFLCLVDKTRRAELDGIYRYFSITQEQSLLKPKVEILANRDEVAKGTSMLRLFDVSSEVAEMLPEIEAAASLLEKLVGTGEKATPVLSTLCRDCEYRGDALSPQGYAECWKKLGNPDPHIFDLFFGTALKEDGGLLIDNLLSQGKASLYDIPLEALKGKRGERQTIQIEYTRKNTEWMDPQLKDFIGTVKYPLHFIDFETTRTALPFHAGMRPFEQIAFQWSCHTVAAPGEDPVHSEWINTEPCFPNFMFARSLAETLSKDGTVLTWASHEGSVLTDILDQMDRYGEKDERLRQFLSLLVSSKGSQGRLVDMNRLTVDYYFHPEMKGKTSIKAVFPAIWGSYPQIRKLPWCSGHEYLEDGVAINPYKKLPAISIAGVDLSVQEGTGAMRAYEAMLFGDGAHDSSQNDSWKKLLLQYCKLDTLAMVVIWEAWRLSSASR